jgi:hypothetical protein
MRTKTILIDETWGKEYAGEYTFKEITVATQKAITERNMTLDKKTGTLKSINVARSNFETFMASLTKQPETSQISLQKLLDETVGVPNALFNKLWTVVEELNGLSEEEEKN